MKLFLINFKLKKRECKRKLSIKNNDIKHEEKDGDFSELNIYGIKIQCPDCGNIFIMDEFGEYFCKRCDRVFPENEIRERCGL